MPTEDEGLRSLPPYNVVWGAGRKVDAVSGFHDEITPVASLKELGVFSPAIPGLGCQWPC